MSTRPLSGTPRVSTGQLQAAARATTGPLAANQPGTCTPSPQAGSLDPVAAALPLEHTLINNDSAIDAAAAAVQLPEVGRAKNEKKNDEECEPNETSKLIHEAVKAPTEAVEQGRKVAQGFSGFLQRGEQAIQEGASTLGKLGEEGVEELGKLGSTLEHANGVVGALGMAAGVITMHGGLTKMEGGDVSEGAADLASGTLTTGSGSSSLAKGVAFVGKNALEEVEVFGKEALPMLETAGKVAGPLAAGASVVSGTVDMAHGYSHLETKKGKEQAISGTAKTVGGALFLAGTAADATGIGAVAGVPLQIAGTAVMIGGAVYEHREAIGHAAEALGEGTVHLAQKVGTGAVHAAEALGEGTVHAAEAVTGAISSGLNSLGSLL